MSTAAHPVRGKSVQTNLLAGFGRVDITPPLPAECVGFVRRVAPATGRLAPLTGSVVVLDEREFGVRLAIVALDLMALGVAQCDALRALVAETVGTLPERVLVNFSHTHAAPHASTGMAKLGGTLRVVHDRERSYIETLPLAAQSAATLAIGDLRPARLGTTERRVEGLAVNRRERRPDGRTILGWNPELAYDPKLTIVRVDDAEGSCRLVLASFPCHPVVLGPENQNVGPDYPGALRAYVERVLGAPCVYLAGAAGNVLPLQAFFAEAGSEVVFGERLGAAAVEACSAIETATKEVTKLGYGSVTPISLYRRHPTEQQPAQHLGAAFEQVALPLLPVPSREELGRELEAYQAAVDEARRTGSNTAAINPLDYHVAWAERCIARLDAGEKIETAVTAPVQALRLHDLAIATLPGEPFNEYATAFEEAAVAPHSLLLGYSNGYVSYFATEAEYPFGGYEPGYAHHNTTMLSGLAPDVERLLTRAAVELSRHLFPAGAT